MFPPSREEIMEHVWVRKYVFYFVIGYCMKITGRYDFYFDMIIELEINQGCGNRDFSKVITLLGYRISMTVTFYMKNLGYY